MSSNARPARPSSMARMLIRAMDAAADMIMVIDTESGRILAANQAVSRTLGYSIEEMLDRPAEEFREPLPPESVQKFKKEIEESGTAMVSSMLKARSGVQLRVECRITRVPLATWDSNSVLFCIARDVGRAFESERLRGMLHEAFMASHDAMFFCDPDGVIMDVNPAFEKHYGYSRQEALGRTPRILRSRHSTKELYAGIWSALLDPSRGQWRGEIVNRAKDGHEIPVLLNITAVRNAAGEVMGYISTALDLTDLKTLRSRLEHAEPLAAMGEMAAVLAHEIRNPLGSILMASRGLAEEGRPAEERAAAIGILQAEARRLNETLGNFLLYAKPRPMRPSLSDLNAAVREVCGLLRYDGDLLKNIRLATDLSTDIAPFPMDVDQIRQVIWNIVLNAAQAMAGKGGELKVRTGLREGFAFIEVSDTGHGIPEASLPAIFKPFQTGKPQGSGLGLAIADRVAKAHGGRIEVLSRQGEGSVFTVLLPVDSDGKP